MSASADDWRHLAACLDEDPALFFAADQERGSHKTAREEEATAVCRRCPAMDWCGQWALDTGQIFGVWGGLTEDERRHLLRRLGRRYRTTTAA